MSQVENGQVSPSINSMEKIAAALGVGLGEFFVAASDGDGGLVVRAGSRQTLGSRWSNAEIETLVASGSMARLEAILITLRPGGAVGSTPIRTPARNSRSCCKAA